MQINIPLKTHTILFTLNPIPMKFLFTFCSLCCFTAIYYWPIEYYTFLRIIISIGALLVIYNALKLKNYLWIPIFCIVLVLFNPILPIYLHRKSIWVPIDLLVGILFLFLAFFKKKESKEISNIQASPISKTYTGDRIISSKILTKQK